METFEPLERISVPELNAILGKSFPVLDQGFVRVIDYMGSDSAIVQAARVSYGKGTKKVREDRELIRYLLRHRHTTPFEMCEIKLHVRVPMDIWRQWIRHRTASVNEYSTRYSLAIDATHATPPEGWRLQSKTQRQGSEDYIDKKKGQYFSSQEKEFHDLARKIYNERIQAGIAREQARKDLPLSTYTEAYWKIDLSNLLHFLVLRMDSSAQWEIRQYADTIGNEIVKRWVPLVWEAFQDYVLGAITFSRDEQKIFKHLLAAHPEKAIGEAEALGWLEKTEDGKLKFHYERNEFEEKLKRMEVPIPWENLLAFP